MPINDDDVIRLTREGLSNVAVARELGCSEKSVRWARKRLNLGASSVNSAPRTASQTAAATSSTTFTLTGDTGSFDGYVSDKPLTDFSDVFRKFNRDPDEFVIVGDVRMRA